MPVLHTRGRPARRVSFIFAVVAALNGATACSRPDSVVGPAAAPALSDTGLSLAVRVPPADVVSTIVLDDAMSRLLPALGSGAGTDALRNAFAALRGELLGDAAAVDRERLAATLATAHAALERIPRGDASAPELDALSLALDALRPLHESVAR